MRVQRAAPIREQVAQHLRAAISEMRLAPGQMLVERELCEATGASRPSVREALRQLESEGLVVSVPGRGTAVATMTVDEARHVYEVRAALEGLAGRLFTENASDGQRKALARAVAKIERTAKKPAELVAAKNRFYEVLLEGTGNPVVQNMLETLHRRVTLLRFTSLAQPDRPAQSVREIDAILDAVQANDPVAAERACIAHIEAAQKSAYQGLQDSDEA